MTGSLSEKKNYIVEAHCQKNIIKQKKQGNDIPKFLILIFLECEY